MHKVDIKYNYVVMHLCVCLCMCGYKTNDASCWYNISLVVCVKLMKCEAIKALLENWPSFI